MDKRRYYKLFKAIIKNWDLYLLILPILIYFIIFHFMPIYGIQIAFKDYIVTKGIWKSPWVGFKHFQRFFSSYYLWRLLYNTVSLSLFQLIAGFPVPIILALSINEAGNRRFKKTVQMVTYAPHFISTVVLVSMVIVFLHPENGFINHLIRLFGGTPVYFMGKAEWFKPVYVISGIWQDMGWSSIIYIAALSNVDQQLLEAAEIDGANKLRRIWHINLPTIAPTIMILLILNAGRIMNVGFEKVFLMQNKRNIESSDVISTFVYQVGMVDGQFSFSSAVGVFNNIINFILLISVNRISKHFTETSLW